MASVATQLVNKVSLKVMVDKERNKVVYAEAGKDFVDALLSFLTLPLGTIARLVAKESNIEPITVGSISSLYKSVSDLDQQYLWSHTCKEMLLKPRSSMEGYCQDMKLNIDDTPSRYFKCRNQNCEGYLSTHMNQKCICGWSMSETNMRPSDLIFVDNGFVNETSTFIIHDDLSVMPSDLGKCLCLLQMNGINDMDNVERKTLLISKKEVCDLLKLSLLSKTPLTDFIFKKEKFIGKSDSTLQSEIKIGKSLGLTSDEGKQNMVVKLMVRKSNREILFAISEEDFADFLFSFLTFPLGGVLNMLQGYSSLSCIDVLYKSLTELSSEKCLRSQKLKDELVKPRIFPKFKLRNQIIPIGMEVFRYKSNSSEFWYFVDPKSPISGGYAKGPSTFMVTDDLVVTPMSSFDAVSTLERMNVPLNDVEEIVISIGVKEGLSILKASLTSTSALTNGLHQYIDKSLYKLGSQMKKMKAKEENEA